MQTDLKIRGWSGGISRDEPERRDVTILDAEADSIPIMSEQRDELAELFDGFAPALRHFFARRGYGSEDCRDLTQETFLKAYKGLSGFREEANLRTWLLSIAANVWKNDLRSRQTDKRSAVREVALDALPVEEEPAIETEGVPVAPNAPQSPLQQMLTRESRERLRAAIAELPPKMQACVRFRIERDLKYREIAILMNVSVDTVKTQLHHARRRLRETLGEHFDLDGGES